MNAIVHVMFSPRTRQLKGHERLYGLCKLSHIYFVKKSIDQYVNKKEVILFKSCSSTQELRNKGNGSFSRKAFRAFVEVQTYT